MTRTITDPSKGGGAGGDGYVKVGVRHVFGPEGYAVYIALVVSLVAFGMALAALGCAAAALSSRGLV